MFETDEPADPIQTDLTTDDTLGLASALSGKTPLAMTANAMPAAPAAEEGDGGSSGG